MQAKLSKLSTVLAQHAAAEDTVGGWPSRSFEALDAARVWRWKPPAEYGGEPLPPLEMLSVYEAVARGSVAVALLLTQRDGAVGLITNAANDDLKQRLLPAYATGERFTSVGIAQLTTSRGRDGRPHMTAVPKGADFVFTGVMPWVSGAERCAEIVCGAVLDDGQQVVAAIPTDSPGFTVLPAMKLLALDASCTTRVKCDAVRVPAAQVLRGPADAVLSRRAPVKSGVVSTVGLGLAASIVDVLSERAATSPAEWRGPVDALHERYARVRARVFAAAAEELADPKRSMPKAELRIAVNELLTQLSTALMIVCKGTGYARPHIAERLAREALFFHVWSAPTEIGAGMLDRLASTSSE